MSSRRYCYVECHNPWFNECADCWQSGGNPALERKQATSPDVRERELSQLRLKIAEAKSYGAYADWDKIEQMEKRRDDLERWLKETP